MGEPESGGKTQVYFDGACHVCSREVGYYARKDQAGACLLEFIDIADPKFDAKAAGLDPQRINQAMHVRSPYGRLHLGMDGFAEIWNRVPGHEWLVRVTRFPGVRQVLALGYWIFARGIRPYLPKRRGK